MLAPPAIQAVLMFLVGTALTLGDLHSRAWAEMLVADILHAAAMPRSGPAALSQFGPRRF